MMYKIIAVYRFMYYPFYDYEYLLQVIQ